MTTIDERCLAYLSASQGKFHRTDAVASALGVPVDEARTVLVRLYRAFRADRMVLVAGPQMIGFYGHRKGVVPGTALRNTEKGRAA